MEAASDRVWMPSKAYSIGRRYVDFCVRRSYRNIIVEGLENVPSDGKVIFAPNHTNTLMDPIVLMQCFKGPTMFGARADIFRKKTVASMLSFCRIVPIPRAKDGLREVENNRRTLDVVCRGLGLGIPFCLFPEGTHRPQDGLQALKKGICRFAGQSGAPVVPVAICYSDWFKYRGNCMVRFGKPVDLNEYADSRDALAVLKEKMMELQEHPEHPKKMHPVFALPLHVVSGAVAWIQILLAWFLIRRLKDKAFANSMRFVCKLVGGPVNVLFWLIVALVIPSLTTAAILVFSPFAQSIYYDTK